MMKRRTLGYILCACVFALGVQPAAAQDASFGEDGFAFADFSDFLLTFSSISGVAVQGDRKIVVAGHARTSGINFSDTSFAVARFNPDGTLDTTFGSSAGRVLIGFNNFDNAAGLVLQSDGRIVVAGFTAATSSGTRSLALARLTPTGALDLTFGTSGRVTRSIGSGGTITAVAIQPNGRILVAGSVVRSGTGADFLLARFLSSGAVDTSFGATGTFPNLSGSITTDFGGQERATAIAIHSDGRIVAAGVTQLTVDSRFAVARYSANGLIDRTFGGSGRVTTNFVTNDHGGSSGDAALGVALQGDGKIVAVGRAETDTGLARTDVALARYNTNGTLDTSFGGDGRVTMPFVAGDPQRADEAAFTVIIQPNGRIVTAGFTSVPFSEVFGIARFNADGTLDTTFGDDGVVVTDRRGQQAFAIATQLSLRDARFIVAGQGSPQGATTRFSVARLFGFLRTFTINGAFDLGPSDATVEVHDPLSYDFIWTVPEPLNWHDLRSLELRIHDGDETILWVRFDEGTNSFSLFDERTGRFTRSLPAGSDEALHTPDAVLHLAHTRVVGSGPTGQTVTLGLALSFKPRAGGRTFMVDVRSTDDQGTQDPFTRAGTLTIGKRAER